MVSRITNRQIILFNIALVAIINMVKGIMDGWHYTRYAVYVGLFVVVFIFYMSIKNSLKFDPYIFFMCGILCILAGNWGNLSGVVFFVFSFFAVEHKEQTIFLFAGLIIITIILKFVFLMRDGTILDVIMYCIGFEFSLMIYFNMMHPRGPVILDEDETNKKILICLIRGYRTKQIADELNISRNAVIKRIAGMREKYNAGNNEQMIYEIMKNVKIGLN